jgi:hypothetical protein
VWWLGPIFLCSYLAKKEKVKFSAEASKTLHKKLYHPKPPITPSNNKITKITEFDKKLEIFYCKTGVIWDRGRNQQTPSLPFKCLNSPEFEMITKTKFLRISFRKGFKLMPTTRFL